MIAQGFLCTPLTAGPAAGLDGSSVSTLLMNSPVPEEGTARHLLAQDTVVAAHSVSSGEAAMRGSGSQAGVCELPGVRKCV